MSLLKMQTPQSLMDLNNMRLLPKGYIEVSDVVFDNDLYSLDKSDDQVLAESSTGSTSSQDSNASDDNSNAISSEERVVRCEKLFRDNDLSDSNDNSSGRRSRSTTREHKSFRSRTRRRRRLSTRSSIDSSSDSSSSCSSCSDCGSYSSTNSVDSNINFKLSTSIARNDTKGHQMSRKRSLKESFCQKGFESKLRSNLENNLSESLMKLKSNRSNSQDIEERKIIYVGKIPDGTTKTDIRCWFGRFGAIKEVSIHFRDSGDNYAFVTFYRRTDAFEAIEHANDDSRHPKFDLSFGGRRQFCKTRYEDLDLAEDQAFGYDRMDFDALLRTTQDKLHR